MVIPQPVFQRSGLFDAFLKVGLTKTLLVIRRRCFLFGEVNAGMASMDSS